MPVPASRPRERGDGSRGAYPLSLDKTLAKDVDVSPLLPHFLHQFYFGAQSGRTGGIITAESVVSSAS